MRRLPTDPVGVAGRAGGQLLVRDAPPVPGRRCDRVYAVPRASRVGRGRGGSRRGPAVVGGPDLAGPRPAGGGGGRGGGRTGAAHARLEPRLRRIRVVAGPALARR